MSERNGPGEMKTERRSPMITSGVATPSTASNNIAVVITIPASNPAMSPAKIAFVLLPPRKYELYWSLCQTPGFSLSGRRGDPRHTFWMVFCSRKNFPHARHYHGGGNLLHAGVIKRALAQATVIAWRTR